MSKRPTSEEKKAFHDLCLLRRQEETLRKQCSENVQPFVKKQKSLRHKMFSLLASDQCMKVNDIYLVRKRTSNLRQIKLAMVVDAISAVTRTEVMANVKGSMSAWDAAAHCIKKRINDQRRTYAESLSRLKRVSSSMHVSPCTEEMKAAVEKIDKVNEDLKQMRAANKASLEPVRQQMDDRKKVILSYMKRARMPKQKVHIGVHDNINRTFKIERKRRKPQLKMDAVLAVVKEKMASMQSLDDLDNDETKNGLIERCLSSLQQSLEEGEEYISLRDCGLRET